MLTKEQISKNQEVFEELLSKIGGDRQKGTDLLIGWLRKTDLYTAPASTKYHHSYNGGLVEHSLQVYKHLVKLVKDYNVTEYKDETLILVALLHDLCKINTYVMGTRNVKNEQTGQWEKVPEWKYNNSLHLGHAEKSLFYITQFYQLNNIEYGAILFHMGFCDLGGYRTTAETSDAFHENPLAFLLHEADMFSTFFGNKRIEE